MGKDGSIESTTAVCGPIVPPQRAANQNSNEGQPRVGELFFIHQEVDNHSLSSMSSDPTAYTETEIEENLTDYPLSVNYALGITAVSTHSSVSSMSHDVVRVRPKKFKSRGILTAFRRKALLSDRPENKVSEDKGAFTGDVVPKTLFTDPAVNASTDPTIDIENQPSQEEVSTNGSAADKGSVLSKAQSSMSSYSEGFGGYIYQNCSELNSRTLKLLIMTAAVLFLFGVSAVVTAFVVDGNPSKTEADNKQLTSLYESPTAEMTSSTSIESPQTTLESPIVSTPTSIAADNATLLQTNATTAPTTVQTVQTTDIEGAASNDVPLQWIITDITTSAATVSATANLTATSITTPAATASASTNLSTGSITNQEASATSPTPSTSTLSATYIQAIASSLLSLTLTNQRKQDNKGDDKENDKVNDKEDDKGKNDGTNTVNVEQVVRFDITPMLNDPRGQPFRVLMRLKNKGNGNVSSDYLPKAGLWNCSPSCDQAEISLENSVVVGTFDESGFLDLALAFSRGIFDNQMTFKLNSREMLATPELVLLWVDGDADDFAGMTAASLMESL